MDINAPIIEQNINDKNNQASNSKKVRKVNNKSPVQEIKKIGLNNKFEKSSKPSNANVKFPGKSELNKSKDKNNKAYNDQFDDIYINKNKTKSKETKYIQYLLFLVSNIII